MLLKSSNTLFRSKIRLHTDIKNIPVFVWRNDIAPDSIPDNHCIYCNTKLILEQFIPKEKQDDILIRLYKEHVDRWASKKWTNEEKDIIKDIIRSDEYIVRYHDEEWNAWDGDKEDGFWNAQDYFCPSRAFCVKCGWWVNYLKFGNSVGIEKTKAASLLKFDLNDSKLTIPEITSHLSKRYSDIYQLSSYRFEEVVAQIYSTMGYNVVLTKKSRDDGADIICLGKDNRVTLVECKRYSKEKKVTINAVDRLLGVKIRKNADEAHLVTSSYFTTPAIKATNQIPFKLVDAHELLSLLNVYSNPYLTVTDLKMIFYEK